MKRLAKILAVIVVVLFGLYYSVMTPGVSLRYRLTVSVDVNGVTHTGSGVIEITYQSYREWVMQSLPLDWARQFHGRMNGNAITVDLGDRGLLFVVNFCPVITGGDGRLTFPEAPFLDQLPLIIYRSTFPRADQLYPTDRPPSEIMDRVAKIRNAKMVPVAVPVTELPMMVRFTDIHDPRSVEEVDPRDLSAAFGSGVHLDSVTFELTRDPVTPMPRIWPTWLKLDKDGPITLKQPRYFVGSLGLGTTAFKGD